MLCGEWVMANGDDDVVGGDGRTFIVFLKKRRNDLVTNGASLYQSRNRTISTFVAPRMHLLDLWKEETAYEYYPSSQSQSKTQQMIIIWEE